MAELWPKNVWPNIFGGKMGVATTRAPNGLGPPNPTKKMARWMDLLGQPLSRNHVFEILRGEPPLTILLYLYLLLRAQLDRWNG